MPHPIEEITIGCLRISSYEYIGARAKVLKKKGWQHIAHQIRNLLESHPSQHADDQREWWFCSMAELKRYIDPEALLLDSDVMIQKRLIRRKRPLEEDPSLKGIDTPCDILERQREGGMRLLSRVKVADAVLDSFVQQDKPLETWEQAIALMILARSAELLAKEAIETSLNLQRAVRLAAIPIQDRSDGLE